MIKPQVYWLTLLANQNLFFSLLQTAILPAQLSFLEWHMVILLKVQNLNIVIYTLACFLKTDKFCPPVQRPFQHLHIQACPTECSPMAGDHPVWFEGVY